MTVSVEVLREVTDEVVEAFGVLMPQLSRSAAPADRAVLAQVVDSAATTLLIARSGGKIAGTLTLVMFPIPTGVRAWIEDVIVDGAARGQGIGQVLTIEALRIAGEAGARTVDLTSRPSREAAGPTSASVPVPLDPPVPLHVRRPRGRLVTAGATRPGRRPPRAAGPHRSGRCSGPGLRAPLPPSRGCRARRSVPTRSCARSTR